MNRSTPFLVFAFLFLSCFSAAQEAPDTSAEKTDTLGWYIVRPGDTLEGITIQFLGEKKLWKDNWELNPQIKNPNRLRIGQRLKIILHRHLPPRTAQILKIGGRVDQQPSPNPWIPASKGNLLKEQDGIRTHKNSSTQLEFDDRTRLTINETSLVFLREVSRSLGGVDREQIEVVEGQADLDLHPRRADSSDVEIILGEVTATPKTGNSGRAVSRLRRPEDGNAQIMVYGGKTRVSAKGGAVEVPSGSGTTVPDNGIPGKPEKLLPAVQLLTPTRNASLLFSNPLLSWKELQGSASYTLEVFRDTDCSRLLLRETDISDVSFRPEELPQGRLFWRVTAVAPSGLDGYPSRPLPLQIKGGPDRMAPVVALTPGIGMKARGEIIHCVPGSYFRLLARDEASGIASMRYRFNGGAWIKVPEERIRLPEKVEELLLEAEATDHAGKNSKTLRARFICDEKTPAAPKIFRSETGKTSDQDQD